MIAKTLKILIIDDDRYFRLALKSIVGKYGLVEEASSEAEAIKRLNSEYYDVVLLDMNIDHQLSGIRILEIAKNKKIHTIIISSEDTEEITEKAYTLGCDHFLTKRFYQSQLEPYLNKFIQFQSSTVMSDFFKTSFITKNSLLIEQIKSLLTMNLKGKCVYITGETGVGKSLVGELLHQFTYGNSRPFIHLNCSEISENLIESELFGHKKGSFTGASEDKKGKLELAHGGTLFLDEIATMPMQMQQKLLKAVDSKTFYPVGSSTPVKTDFTLISATCEDLFTKIANKEFRKDLFFRISGLNIEIPPLRERKEDILLLIKHFIKQSPRKFIIKQDAIDYLVALPWDGNVREIKKIIELLSLTSHGIVEINDIQKMLNHKVGSTVDEDSLLSAKQVDYILKHGLRSFITQIEKNIALIVMEKNNKKITGCIKDLQISSSAFYRILDELSS
jgi:DNA-binding NtrC family response regulator